MKTKQTIVKLLSLILCLLFVLAGCGDADGDEESVMYVTSEYFEDVEDDSPDSSVASGTSSEKTTSKDSSDGTAVSSKIAEQMKGTIDLKGKTLTVLIPAKDTSLEKRFAEFCNGKIKFITASYTNLKSVLATKVMSGDAPDIYYLTNQDYPSILYKDLLQPINDKIDLDSDLWKSAKQTFEQFKWTDGKNYFVGEYELGNSFWYNKKIFADAGVKDTPETLMKAGKWNWDTFLEIEKKVANVDKGIYGFGSESNFCYACLASAGEDIVYMDKNKGLVNNVNSANVAKAMDFMQKAYDPKYCFAGDGYKLFSQGKMAMFYGYSGHGSDANFVKQLNTGNYAFALFPKMTGYNESKYRVSGTVTGYAIPKGAKNVDCAIAFLTMNRVDTAYKDQLNKEYITKNGLQKTNFEEIYNLYFQQKFIPIASLGVSKINDVFWPAESKIRGGTPWATMKEQLSPNIDKAINSLKSN